MLKSKSYLFYGAVLLVMMFVFITLAKIRTPLDEISRLPRCDNNVVISEELKSSVIRFSNNYLSKSVGEIYFQQHFHFFKMDYSPEGCVFVVTYSYSYGNLHTMMNLKLKAYSQQDFEVIEVNSFLRPVEVRISDEEALNIAETQDIKYDFYNLDASITRQTFVYIFYRRTITEGADAVLEIDAQSGQIRTFEKVLGTMPLV